MPRVQNIEGISWGHTSLSQEEKERETMGTEGSKMPQCWFWDVVCFHKNTLVLITQSTVGSC